MSANLPLRSVRNRNPGNLRDSKSNTWLGQIGADADGFAVFSETRYGVRALCKLLDNYMTRNVRTPRSIIFRYAPPADDNPSEVYALYVANHVGVKVDDVVTPADIPKMVDAIAQFEGHMLPRNDLLDGVKLWLDEWFKRSAQA